MIIDVHKYLVLGTKEDIDLFFERAQASGFLEFIAPSLKKNIEVPQAIDYLLKALKILKKLPLRKKYDGLWERPYADFVAKRVIELRDEVEKFAEEKRIVEAEIFRVSPFGEFSMDDIDFIEKHGKRKVQFFCVKASTMIPSSLASKLIYIATEYDLDYYISINPSHEIYPDMIEMRIDRSCVELKNQLSFIKEAISDLEAELKSYAGHIEFLYEMLLEQLNEFHLESAKKDVSSPLASSSLFSVEAWIPKSKEGMIHTLLDGLSVHCERIKVDEGDKLPTFIENTGLNVLGEDLVKIYDIPATSDKDPSGWVFWFFALFFAIIVADGGYGMLYLATAIYLKYKFPSLQHSGKRLLKLFTILSCFVIGWGVLTSSFFGLRIDRNSFLGKISPLQYLVTKKADYHLKSKDSVYKFWLDDYPAIASAKSGDEFLNIAVKQRGHAKIYEAKNAFSDNILLEVSLLLGVIHISLSFMRYFFRSWAGIGWIALMIGGYLFFPLKLGATSLFEFTGMIDATTARQIGLQLIYSGIGLAVVLSFIQKGCKGLGEIMNLIQVFADVLSYLRLYALALAGSIMATTFNDMGTSIGLLGGFIVVIAGHGVNILLGVMAGVIHGLRLNFIEWYHFSFDGGGRLFKPLQLLKSEEE